MRAIEWLVLLSFVNVASAEEPQQDEAQFVELKLERQLTEEQAALQKATEEHSNLTTRLGDTPKKTLEMCESTSPNKRTDPCQKLAFLKRDIVVLQKEIGVKKFQISVLKELKDRDWKKPSLSEAIHEYPVLFKAFKDRKDANARDLLSKQTELTQLQNDPSSDQGRKDKLTRDIETLTQESDALEAEYNRMAEASGIMGKIYVELINSELKAPFAGSSHRPQNKVVDAQPLKEPFRSSASGSANPSP